MPFRLSGKVWSSKRIRFVVRFVLACLLAFVWEKTLEQRLESHNEGGWVAQRIFDVDTLYQRMVKAGPRKPRPRFTTLVEINPARETGIPTRDNICAQRIFLSSLLKMIASAQPLVVVVDKYFSTTACIQAPEATEALREGFKTICQDGAAVVVGAVATQDNDDQYPKLEPSLSFQAPESCDFRAGLANIDPDSRRVPLIWYCASPNGEKDEIEAVPSLSLAAAKAALPEIADQDSRLTSLLKTSRNPFTTVFRENVWANYSIIAGEIVCGKPISAGDDWRACRDYQLPDIIRRRLRGRVVVVGEYSPEEDTHATALGGMPGYVLQAGYIESLLDDRLFQPVSEAINYAAGFIFFAFFEYICEMSSSWIIILKRVMLLGFAASALVYFIVIHAGYFLDPATFSIAYLTVRLSDLIVARIGGDHPPTRVHGSGADDRETVNV